MWVRGSKLGTVVSSLSAFYHQPLLETYNQCRPRLTARPDNSPDDGLDGREADSPTGLITGEVGGGGGCNWLAGH